MDLTDRRTALRVLGAIVAAGAIGAGLIAAEASLAAGRPYAQVAPANRGLTGSAHAPVVTLAVLGDSTAEGLGVARAGDTAAGQMAALLDRYRVRWSSYGVRGARAADLAPQVERVLGGARPDLALVLIGANDAVHFTPLETVAADVRDAVRRLRARGIRVVVGTCPDMGAARALLEPLRTLIALRGDRTARVEIEAVRAAGGTAVDLAAETGAAFRADPRTLSDDRFHPSARGYGLWARALAPAARNVLRERSNGAEHACLQRNAGMPC